MNTTVIIVAAVILGIMLFVAFTKKSSSSNKQEHLSTKPVLRLYTMVGCKYCDDFNPTWMKLKNSEQIQPLVDFAQLDETNTDGVTSFPTLRLYTGTDFKLCESRDFNDIIAFIQAS